MAKDKLISVMEGAVLAASGAAIAFAADAASAGAFGPYSVFVGAAATVVLHVLRKATAPAA
jgi:hypothetical protein